MKIAMPNLISMSLRPRDCRMRRLAFKHVATGTIFYSQFRWYQKRSSRTAFRADVEGEEVVRFKYKTMVRILDESGFTPPPLGLSFEDFMRQAAL